MKSNILLLTILICALFSVSLLGDETGDLLNLCRVQNGIICVADCGDGSLPLSLAEKSRFIVLALDERDEMVVEAKEKAISSGLYGRRLYVQQRALVNMPWADHYIDLLVLTKRKEKDLNADERREILRVLTPIHGRAVLADTTIDQPELPGSDWWPHKLHGPNNNPVSADTVFSFPPILQYRAMPMMNPAFGMALTMGGVHFEAMDQLIKTPVRLGLTGLMYARNLYNGRILWKAHWPNNTLPTTPTQAIDSGLIYLAGGDGARVLRRDLLTGMELAPIELGSDDQRIKWLAIEQGTLYVLIGGKFEMTRPFSPYAKYSKKEWSEKQTFGDELLAWDLTSGKRRWTHLEESPIDNGNVAVSEGRLYYYTDGKRVTCLSGNEGRKIWTFENQEIFKKLTRPVSPNNHALAKTSLMIVADGLVRIAVADGDETFLLSSTDGRLIGGANCKWTLKKSVVISGNLYLGKDVMMDGETGKTEKLVETALPSPAGTGWCGQMTYAQGTGLLGHSSLGYKSPCPTGVWVAGGMLAYGPTVCDCSGTRGAGTFSSGGEILKKIEQHPEHPLVRGPAFIIKSIEGEDDTLDWPAYRGGIGHRGSSLVTVPNQMQTMWQVALEHPFSSSAQQNMLTMEFDERPVPSIAFGDKVYGAGSDGLITARSLKDGHLLWTFAADGPVLTSPAYSGGRLFIPGGDGWLYALDAISGQLAWKTRLAPMARRILLFDQLMSNWPVLSLAVKDDVVYASAGHMASDGGKSFALSAINGKILWSRFHRAPNKSVENSNDLSEYVQGFGGQTTLVGERVWSAGFHSVPLSLDRKDGIDHHEALLPKILHEVSWRGFKNLYASFSGQDVIALDQNHVLVGGSYLLDNQGVEFARGGVKSYRMIETDDKGDWNLKHVPLQVIDIALVAPACSDEFIVFAGPPSDKKRSWFHQQASLGLYLWHKGDFLAAAAGMVKKNPVSEVLKGGKAILKFDPRAVGVFPYDQAHWKKPELDIRALALGKNAIIVAHAESFSKTDNSWNKFNEPEKGLITYSGWKVSAFGLDEGKELWSLSLPSEPLRNGLAIAREGQILVSLRDGGQICVVGR